MYVEFIYRIYLVNFRRVPLTEDSEGAARSLSTKNAAGSTRRIDVLIGNDRPGASVNTDTADGIVDKFHTLCFR